MNLPIVKLLLPILSALKPWKKLSRIWTSTASPLCTRSENLAPDTGVNESHHVPAKKASLLTQRDANKIEEQTAERMLEMEVLALVKLKIGGAWLCNYGAGHADDVPDAVLPGKTRCWLGGAVCHTCWQTLPL